MFLSSILTESDQPIAPHLLAAYTDILGLDSMPAADAIVQMWPLLRFSMPGRTARATSIGAIVLMPIVLVISAVVILSNVLFPVTIPAQFMSMSTSPHSAIVFLYEASTASLFDTSVT